MANVVVTGETLVDPVDVRSTIGPLLGLQLATATQSKNLRSVGTRSRSGLAIDYRGEQLSFGAQSTVD